MGTLPTGTGAQIEERDRPYPSAVTAQRRPAEREVRFEPALEAQFTASRLRDSRMLVRMACLLGLLVTLLRLADAAASDADRTALFAGFMSVVPAIALITSLVLTALAWSPLFGRWYLPLATMLVPVRGTAAGVAVAVLATRGHHELLMLLPVMMLSPFFFLGLHFRTALVSVVLTMTAFGLAALVVGMPGANLLRTCAFLLVTAATSAVAAWQLERQARRSFIESRLIAELADHDALTGTKNRRVLDEHLARLWHQAVRDERRLAILLIDVDYFKAYNDRYGHQAGDIALQRLAHTVQAQLHRPLDLLARYGGEEFAALLYDVAASEAVEIAERIRMAVAALQLPHHEAGEASFVTVSIGVAAVQPVAERAPLGALQLADEALYTAKIRGRNNVHLAADAAYRQLETGVFAQHASAR